MEVCEYFARISVLACFDQGIKPSTHAWFPSQYLASAKEKAKTVRTRRNMFYSRTREHYKLLKDKDGSVFGLSIRFFVEKKDASTNDKGEGK
jgi:hypothetical protein